jgi:hypothetical protein
MIYVVEKSAWEIFAAHQGTREIVQRQELTDKTDFFLLIIFYEG